MTNETNKPESFAELFAESLAHQEMRQGEVITAEVVRVDYNFVVVNAGLKSEAYVPIEEFKDDRGEVTVQPGDFISVAIESVENGYGDTILSRDKAKRLAAWMNLEQALESGELVTGTVTGKVKGGLTVMTNGIRAFLPGSLVDTRPVKDTTPYEGKTFEFKVIKLDRKRNNVVVSRRAVVEANMGEERAKLLETLKEGAIVKGIVKNITDYGAFVDLGGIDGLLHITDLAWRRVRHPSEVVQVGQELEAKVLKFDQDKNRVSLGLKQLVPDPWQDITARFPEASRHNGKVTNLVDYGAFVELEPGVEGLVHISEMSWTRKLRHPSQMVHTGDEVEVVILGVDGEKKRISLGMKQVRPNPWELVAEKYPEGTILEGVIKNITEFGMFIGIEDGIDGLIHVSDISWTKKVRHPNEIYKVGDTVQAKVLTVDQENEKFTLGIKQLVDDPWGHVPSTYPVGCTVKGVVTNITDFGLFVEVEEGIEGLVHVSELSSKKIKSPAELYKEGQEIQAKVIHVSAEERRLGLSIKQIKDDEDRRKPKEFHAGPQEAGQSLGDLLKAAQENN